MTSPEINAEILEGFRQKFSSELLRIHGELDGLSFFTPEILTDEKTKVIEATVDSLTKEAKAMGQLPIAEILADLEISFYSLHTIGTVDNLDKFQTLAGHILDKIETILLMIPSTSEAVLKSIHERQAKY